MLLDVADLNVTVGLPAGRVAVLRDISFTVEPGRILGLVGESGAGKSMIGRVVAGLLPPAFRATARRFSFHGQELLDLSPTRKRALLGDRIAFIPQEPLSALNPVRTVGSQFEEHLARLGVPRGQRRARTAQALGEVRLARPERLLDLYPFQLSGGMCQRVLIAMAFSSDPALVVADEPTTALDVTIQAQVMELLDRLRQQLSMAMLLITHDLGAVAQWADRVAVMYAGRIVERGPATQVLGSPRHPYTKGLLDSIPGEAPPGSDLAQIPGAMPSLMALPPGCAFRPRCRYAAADCGTMPALASGAGAHDVRCHHPLASQPSRAS